MTASRSDGVGVWVSRHGGQSFLALQAVQQVLAVQRS